MSATDFKKSGERPVDADGRSYHSGCAFGEVSRHLIVGGARGRVETFMTTYCTQARRLGASERDLPVYHAMANGNLVGRVSETLDVSMGAHGMGVGSLGTTFEEMLWGCGRLTPGETIDVIRAGSCGSVNPTSAPLGTTILVDYAYDESKSYPWIPIYIQPRPNPEVLAAMIQAAKLLGFPYVVGAEITTNCFYRGQRRQGLLQEIFPDSEGEVIVDQGYMFLLQELERAALAYSMEGAGIFRLARAAVWKGGKPAIRAGVALAIYAQRDPEGGNSAFVNAQQKAEADDRCAKIALLAHYLLNNDCNAVDRMRS